MIWQGGYAAMDWLGGEWPEGVLPVPADLPSLAAVLSQPDLRLSVSQTFGSQSARPSALSQPDLRLSVGQTLSTHDFHGT